jgi:phage repressor protein C with HTH and peptisase S24 domain
MIKFIKVTGQSLSPEYQEGDFVAIVTIPFLMFKPGNTIVFEHPTHGTLIKKILHIDPDGIFVTGTQPDSVDSRRFGPIERRRVLGKVMWHIRKPK